MVGQTLGGFEVLEEIGRGGMGVVYKARQISLNRTVALKILPSHYAGDETAAERFTREAHNMARLRHPNIVDVIEVGEQNGVRYFAMQYIEGDSLASSVEREGALPAERVAELGAQIADALGHAHAQGIIHRDIKPGNILIDQHGRAVVTDFGIAKTAEGSGLTREGMVLGVPEYMSPEVVKGNPIDGRSDLYSLGVVLYQMVTGRVPFTATTPIALIGKHVNEPPVPPSAVGAACPQWLESIILKALAKQPADRFGSGGEMAAALRAGVSVAPATQEFPANVAAATPSGLESPEPTRPTSRFLPAAIALVGFALIAVAVALLVRPTRPGDDVGGGAGTPEVTGPIPNAVGRTRDEAVAALEAQGYTPEEAPGLWSQAIPAGQVIDQRPPAGATPDGSASVELLVSLGDPTGSIQDSVREWARKWGGGDADEFLACYARDARIWCKGEWWGWDRYLGRQRELMERPRAEITVTLLTEPQVDFAESTTTAQARFRHRYVRTGWDWSKSTRIVEYTGSGLQELDFQYEGDRWLIVRDYLGPD